MRLVFCCVVLAGCKANVPRAQQDNDEDGFSVDEGDCNDNDDDVHPGADEIWYDGTDQDCDGNDEDQDLDGSAIDEDCDDEDDSIHPGAPEALDGTDTDCDGTDYGAFVMVDVGQGEGLGGPSLSQGPERVQLGTVMSSTPDGVGRIQVDSYGLDGKTLSTYSHTTLEAITVVGPVQTLTRSEYEVWVLYTIIHDERGSGWSVLAPESPTAIMPHTTVTSHDEEVFAQLSLHDDGELVSMVSCAEGQLRWHRGTAEQFINDTEGLDIAGDWVTHHRCDVRGARVLVVNDSYVEELTFRPYPSILPTLSGEHTDARWITDDTMVAAGPDGLQYIDIEGSVAHQTEAAPQRLATGYGSSHAFVAYTDDAGDVHLVSGHWREKLVETTVAEGVGLHELDLELTSEALFMAARSGDNLTLSVTSL